jgi:predicted PurR-regulated permease PerM
MPDQLTRVLLRIAALLIILWALRAAQPIAVPLIFALFLMGVCWPIYGWVRRLAPRVVAAVAALLFWLIVLGGIAGGLYYSGVQIAADAPQIAQQLSSETQQLRSWAEQLGLPIPAPDKAAASAGTVLKRASSHMLSASTGLFLALTFLVLGLLEVRAFRHKLVGDRVESALARSLSDVATDFQRYIAARTFLGLLTGVLSGLGAWAIGLDYPFIWGLTNFLLNYFPTIGSILGVLPPALYALAQSDGGMGLALLSLGVIGGIQLIMGNYIDPLVQGRVLSLSPLIVLFSVAFWGWMWGVAGAFIGVPITIATVLICRRFESTRWIATLLAETEDSRALPVVDDLRLDKHHRENASRTSSESEADRGSVDQVASSS